MSANLNTREVDGVTVVDVSGRIALAEGSSAIRDNIQELLAAGKKKIILNLTGMTDIDNSGVRELASALTAVANAGGTLKLLGMNRRVRDKVQIARL